MKRFQIFDENGVLIHSTQFIYESIAEARQQAIVYIGEHCDGIHTYKVDGL